MIEISRLTFFMGAALALLLIPGPAVLYITARSANQGHMAGIISVLAIETANFFFAFLPQFVAPDKGNVTEQTLLLGALFVGRAIITDSMYALLASSLAERLRGNRHFQKGQRYFAGLVYVGLGITTALTGSKK